MARLRWPQFGRTIALPSPDGGDAVAAENEDDDEHAFDGDDISLSQWQLVVSGCLTSILSSVAAFCSSSHLEVQERVRLSFPPPAPATISTSHRSLIFMSLLIGVHFIFQAVSLRHFATWLSAQLQSPGISTGSSFESFLDVPELDSKQASASTATRADSTPDHLVVVQAVASELSAFFADSLNPVHPKAQSKVLSRIVQNQYALSDFGTNSHVVFRVQLSFSRCRSRKDSILIHGSTNPSRSPKQLRMINTPTVLTFLGRFPLCINALQSYLRIFYISPV